VISESNAKISKKHKIQNLTLAPQLVNKNLQAQHELGSSSENRYGKVSASHRHGDASNMLEAFGTDGVEKWSQQIIAEFDTEFVADTAVNAKSSGREPYVSLGDAQRAPFWIANTGMMSADTAVSAAVPAARPPPLAAAQASTYVSERSAGSGSVQVTVHEAAQSGLAVPMVTRTRRESPEAGDAELTTTRAMETSTMVSGATVLRPQLGKCSDSSGGASTVHEFVYETDATVGSELLQPGQLSPPTRSQPGTQPLSQHGLPLTSSTLPTQPPVLSEPKSPVLHVSASQDGQRVTSTQPTERSQALPAALLVLGGRHFSPRFQLTCSLTSWTLYAAVSRIYAALRPPTRYRWLTPPSFTRSSYSGKRFARPHAH